MNVSTVIRGGARAIAASRWLLARQRRGDVSVPATTVVQIEEQMRLAVGRVMAEGSLYDRTLAALAIKQAQGDLVEAAFLVRAYRTTLERIGSSEPVDTSRMRIERRVATTHRDASGGQMLGATYDYTHRLIDFALLADADPIAPLLPAADAPLATSFEPQLQQPMQQPSGAALLEADLLEPAGASGEPPCEPPDLTREPLTVPCRREQRLQALARADEGFLVGLAYSSMRGFGRVHPYITELVCGRVKVALVIPEIGEVVAIGEIEITECRTIHADTGASGRAPEFTRGYGLVLGAGERKAIAMAVLDRGLRARELGEDARYPAHDEEFVLMHADNIDASGLVQHLKLPHYVDFEAVSQMLQDLRRRYASAPSGDAE
jgi:alpha-D-ribose 1-methylphosphonate 5-triphosphate synthase subunit PhnI